MIPVLVLTHGDLAISILESARMIDPHLVDSTDAVTLPVGGGHRCRDRRSESTG